jgi:glycosyltransferase involved in cell wall biosynthesis
VVAPLRVARGIQNKVLEAMAMGRPVVVTSAAAAALTARLGVDLEVADDAAAFATKVLAVMDPAAAAIMGRLARARILADYAWPSRFARLDELIARGETTRPTLPPACASPRPATAAVSAR